MEMKEEALKFGIQIFKELELQCVDIVGEGAFGKVFKAKVGRLIVAYK